MPSCVLACAALSGKRPTNENAASASPETISTNQTKVKAGRKKPSTHARTQLKNATAQNAKDRKRRKE